MSNFGIEIERFGARHNAWWTLWDHEDDMSRAVCESASMVSDETIDRQNMICRMYALYGVKPEEIGSHLVLARKPKERMKENVVASAIHTWIAQITQARPRTMFLTTGGTYDERADAKKLTAFCDAKGDELRVRRLFTTGLRDAAVAGLGYLRPYVDRHSKSVKAERKHPLHVLLDDVSCVDCLPRVLYTRDYVDKHAWAMRYPEHAELIMSMPHPYTSGAVFADPRADVIEVIEAWHLPSLPPAFYDSRDEFETKTDGVHVIAINGAVLFKEKYDQEQYPGVFLRATHPTRGFWGISMVEQFMEAQQKELNKLQQRKSDSMHAISVPRWSIKVGDFHSTQMVNNIGAFIKTKSGVPPVLLNPRAVNVDVDERIVDCRSSIFRGAGISEDFAQSQVPAGLSGSGRSQLVYNDTKSARQVDASREYEDARVEFDYDLVRQQKKLADWMKEEHGVDVDVLYERRGAKVKIPWSKLNVDLDRLRVQAFPTSGVFRDPASRLQVGEMMLEKGAIEIDQWAEILEFPEVSDKLHLLEAPRRWLENTIDDICEGKAYYPPPPELDPKLAMSIMPRAILRAMLDGVPESRVNALRQFMVQLVAEKNLGAPLPTAPLPGMPPMVPPAAPGMPPGPMPPPAGGVPPDMPPMPMPPIPPEGIN